MALSIYYPGQFTYGFAEQTAWGTVIADNAAFVKIYTDPPDINDGIGVLERPNLAGGARVSIAAEYEPHTKQAMSEISIPAMTVLQDELSYWLYLFFQNVSESAATPYGKTFTFSLTSQPDFTADAGKFVTFAEWDAISGVGRKWKDCICSELVIAAEPNGFMTVQPKLVSRGTHTHASTFSGTWTASSDQKWHYADVDRATYNVGGGAVTVNLEGGWELSLSRTVQGVGEDGSGNYQSFVLGKPEIQFKFTAVHGAITDAMYTARDAGTQTDFRLGIGNATAGTDDGDFDIVCSGKVLVDALQKLQDGEITLVEVPVKVLADDSATAPITIIVADADDKAW